VSDLRICHMNELSGLGLHLVYSCKWTRKNAKIATPVLSHLILSLEPYETWGVFVGVEIDSSSVLLTRVFGFGAVLKVFESFAENSVEWPCLLLALFGATATRAATIATQSAFVVALVAQRHVFFAVADRS
jgi:hypothetical protein